jgi:hypothetical protein
MTRSRVTTLVALTVGSSRVVAAHDLADPVSRIADHLRDGGGGQFTRQQLQKAPPAALNGVMA